MSQFFENFKSFYFIIQYRICALHDSNQFDCNFFIPCPPSIILNFESMYLFYSILLVTHNSPLYISINHLDLYLPSFLHLCLLLGCVLLGCVLLGLCSWNQTIFIKEWFMGLINHGKSMIQCGSCWFQNMNFNSKFVVDN